MASDATKKKGVVAYTIMSADATVASVFAGSCNQVGRIMKMLSLYYQHLHGNAVGPCWVVDLP